MAESSTGANVDVCTTDDSTKTVDALVYNIDPPLNVSTAVAFTKADRSGVLHRPGQRGGEDRVPERAVARSFTVRRP